MKRILTLLIVVLALCSCKSKTCQSLTKCATVVSTGQLVTTEGTEAETPAEAEEGQAQATVHSALLNIVLDKLP